MTVGGGGDLDGGTKGLFLVGFILLTWKVGWTRMDLGSLSLMAAGLMTLETGKGPMKRGKSLRDTVLRDKSLVDSQTL